MGLELVALAFVYGLCLHFDMRPHFRLKFAGVLFSALTRSACNVVKMQARHTQKAFKKAGLA